MTRIGLEVSHGGFARTVEEGLVIVEEAGGLVVGGDDQG